MEFTPSLIAVMASIQKVRERIHRVRPFRRRGCSRGAGVTTHERDARQRINELHGCEYHLWGLQYARLWSPNKPRDFVNGPGRHQKQPVATVNSAVGQARYLG
jgi:hypothetical protein